MERADDPSQNPYEAVEVTQDQPEVTNSEQPAPMHWARRLLLLGFVVGFGIGVVLGVQVIRLSIQEEDAGFGSAIGLGLYTGAIATVVVGLPLAVGGWIIGAIMDLGIKPSDRM